MAQRQYDIALRHLNALFSLGAVGDLTDGELLTLFTARRDEAAELAFAVLVDRHGPMVLKVCHALLRDSDDVQDAFQATFLVLVEKGAAFVGARLSRSVAASGSLSPSAAPGRPTSVASGTSGSPLSRRRRSVRMRLSMTYGMCCTRK